jgi:hypothetical protein
LFVGLQAAPNRLSAFNEQQAGFGTPGRLPHPVPSSPAAGPLTTTHQQHLSAAGGVLLNAPRLGAGPLQPSRLPLPLQLRRQALQQQLGQEQGGEGQGQQQQQLLPKGAPCQLCLQDFLPDAASSPWAGGNATQLHAGQVSVSMYVLAAATLATTGLLYV